VERGDLAVHIGEAISHEGPYSAAGCSPALALAQHSGELVERESDEERAANEENARQSLPRIAAVSSRGPRRRSEQTLALVVTKGVGAHPGALRQLARTESARFDVHLFPTSIESPVR
jgi:hypothetical protein